MAPCSSDPRTSTFMRSRQPVRCCGSCRSPATSIQPPRSRVTARFMLPATTGNFTHFVKEETPMTTLDRQAVLDCLSRLVTPGIKLTALADELGARKHE